MAWPTGIISTDNFDDGATDSPAAARVDLWDLIINCNQMLEARGDVLGVAPLDANAKVPASNLPVLLAVLIATGATTLAQLKTALGLNVATGRMTIPFAFVGQLQQAADGLDFALCSTWVNQTGFIYTLENTVISHCGIAPAGAVALLNVEVRESIGGPLIGTAKTLALNDGKYQVSYIDNGAGVIGLDVPANGTISFYLASAAYASGFVPPQDLCGHHEGYLKTS